MLWDQVIGRQIGLAWTCTWPFLCLNTEEPGPMQAIRLSLEGWARSQSAGTRSYMLTTASLLPSCCKGWASRHLQFRTRPLEDSVEPVKVWVPTPDVHGPVQTGQSTWAMAGTSILPVTCCPNMPTLSISSRLPLLTNVLLL